MKRHAPATERNREGIAAVLTDTLPAAGTVLEIASGTGEHCAYFAGLFPDLTWKPSDPDAESRESIAAWCAGLQNVRPPLDLDVSQGALPAADAILCVNMVHISPWEATVGLFTQGSKLLAQGAPLILYGPYFREGHPTAPSNLAFDESLKGRNPDWGIRWLEDVTELAVANGFSLAAIHEMPANNLTLVYRRA